MKATPILTATVIDLNTARAARRARPFQGRLLKQFAAGLAADQLAALRAAIAEGVASGVTTQEITRTVLRDQVQRKARAAL